MSDEDTFHPEAIEPPRPEDAATQSLDAPGTPGSDTRGTPSTIVRPQDGCTPAPNTPRPTVPGYEIISELGRGGMGVIYKARHIGLNRIVALKMILASDHAGTEAIARFRAEAEAVAQLRHPNLIQVYDIGAQDGRPYFSMEFVEGTSLQKRIGGQPQPPKWCAEIAEKLALAMHAAHSQGIIHRDLKPTNVLLTKEGEPRIMDFGLAKRLKAEETLTQSGAVMGTPHYMAPEQASGEAKRVGPQADVYALGAILYHMLTGQPPFHAETTLATLQQVMHAEPRPPSRISRKVTRDLETICLKCLEKDPQKRYASAHELAADLRRFLNHEPILARRAGPLELAMKWVRRRPSSALIFGLTLLAGAAVLSVTFYQRITQDQLLRVKIVASDSEIASLRVSREELKQMKEGIAQKRLQEANDLVKGMRELIGLADFEKVAAINNPEVQYQAAAAYYGRTRSDTLAENGKAANDQNRARTKTFLINAMNLGNKDWGCLTHDFGDDLWGETPFFESFTMKLPEDLFRALASPTLVAQRAGVVSLDPAANLALAKAKLWNGDSDGAIADLKRSIALGPESDAARKAEAQLAVINHPLQPTEFELHEWYGWHVAGAEVSHWKRLCPGKFAEQWTVAGKAISMHFVVTSRDGQRGTIVFDKSRNIEVLLPDRENTTAKAWWRMRGHTEWNCLGEMRYVK